MATWIKTDGTQIEIQPKRGKKFTLQELRDCVGGWIEIVYRGACFDMQHDGTVMVVNEEGWLIPLPQNIPATLLAGQPIAGNVVIAKFGVEID